VAARQPRGVGLAAALLLALLPPVCTAQSDEEKAREQLRKLQQDIRHINREIASASAHRDKLQEQLREAETELGALQTAIAENERALAENERQLASLETELAAQTAARDRQQGRIAAELRAAWEMGRQGQVRLLLSQESPHTVARALGYYRRILEARSDLLDAYRETLAQLQLTERLIGEKQAQLASRRESLAQQQESLAAASRQRELAMAELAANISEKNTRLRRMEQDRAELESLLRAIEEAVVNLQVPDNFQPFRKARGKMPWPLQGKPASHFGQPRNEGKMVWQGVTIPAKEGSQVSAIHHGRVVFADWLRGSGLLLIIDHGDGYLSLYAHNQSLLREVGEWVTAGAPVSTVGRSGGQEQAALYFEIRHNGKPVDPAHWCRG
jgi:septal ring factor EnvC (AmiA/AmiB activator)